jgi:hypothetical protein
VRFECLPDDNEINDDRAPRNVNSTKFVGDESSGARHTLANVTEENRRGGGGGGDREREREREREGGGREGEGEGEASNSRAEP